MCRALNRHVADSGCWSWPGFITAAILATAASWTAAAVARADTQRLESSAMLVQIDSNTGNWSLVDKASGVRWPSEGAASPGTASGLRGRFDEVSASQHLVRLAEDNGAAVPLPR